MWHHEKPPQDAAEEEFLVGLLQFARTAKKSHRPEIAAAARRWESKLAFRIKVHQQAISSRSTWRNRSGAVPSRGSRGIGCAAKKTHVLPRGPIPPQGSPSSSPSALAQ